MNTITTVVASGLGPSATATLATKDHLTAAPSMRRQATLTLAPCRKRRGSKEAGQAYGGRLECAGHTIWMEDAIALGVIAYVLDVGRVELQLPTFRHRSSTLYAHQRQLPLDVIDLYNGVGKSLLKRQNEAAEALFVQRFATGLRVCTQSMTEVPSLVDWYRQKMLPAAVKAAPSDLRVNDRI